MYVFASGEDAVVIVSAHAEEQAREFLRNNGYPSASLMVLLGTELSVRVEAHCSDGGPYITTESV